ncbi:MAG: PilZ domain-containing protein [Desulfobacteraceae bacterium]|nr:PilZ domain-containing protein [Desulfobacteraceae bacterium]
MKKRKCKRFTILGATLYYKKRGSFFRKTKYSLNYFPVLDISMGGASFLTNQRIKTGSAIIVKFTIPDIDFPLELEVLCTTRWIARNREESYRFRTGISFNTYGNGKHQNKFEILEKLKELEQRLCN